MDKMEEKNIEKNNFPSERYVEIMKQFKRRDYGRVLPPIESYNKIVQTALDGKLDSNIDLNNKPFQSRGGLFWKLRKGKGIEYAFEAIKGIGNRNLKVTVYSKKNLDETVEKIENLTEIKLEKEVE
jgi:hypothetical protein